MFLGILDFYTIRDILNTQPEQKNTCPLPDVLSELELEVLRLIAAGLSNAEIAEHLVNFNRECEATHQPHK
jgi:ATP/maltotriose-dependent transcriptional regulator MalT